MAEPLEGGVGRWRPVNMEQAEVRIEELEAELAKCFRATGSEPAGVDRMDARYALQAVEETRREAEEEWDLENARANALKADLSEARETLTNLALQATNANARAARLTQQRDDLLAWLEAAARWGSQAERNAYRAVIQRLKEEE